MKQKRRERISSSLRSEIAEIIQRDLRDPRLGFISVTRVEPTEDLKEAVVHVSILGSETEQRTSLRGLRAAAGFMQGLIADRMRLRNTPVLRFELDESIRKHMELEELLKRARSGNPPDDEEE